LEKLLVFAREKHAAKKRLATTFESDILRQASPAKFGWRRNGLSE